MEQLQNEELRRIDDIVQSVDCLVMSLPGPQQWRNSHYHTYMELLYVQEGAYELKVGNSIHHLAQGDLFVILPGQPHCTRRLMAQQTLLCVKFLPRILFTQEADDAMPEHLAGLVLERYSQQRHFSAGELEGTPVPQAIKELCRESQAQDFASALAVRYHLCAVYLWLIRYWHDSAGQPLLSMRSRNAALSLAPAREYVQSEYATATTAQAALACGLSYGYFSHLFHSCMGVCFSDYVLGVRIARAQQLLVSTGKSITEIAMEVGFSTASYFAQVFRNRTGVSPGQYRRNTCQGR